MTRVVISVVQRILRRHRRRGALIFALLAILANQALLPTLHFAAGMPGMAQHDMAAMPPHMQHVGNHAEHGAPRGGDHGGIDHQVCHFCRLLGAALPPPPDTVLVGRSDPHGRPVFRPYLLARPAEYFGTGHYARGPPSLLA